MGGNGDPEANYAVVTGPFARDTWTITIFDYGADQRRSAIVRNFGSASLAPTLPTAADVAAAMSIATYDVAPWNSTAAAGTSFRNALEGYRDCVDEMCDPVNRHDPHLHQSSQPPQPGPSLELRETLLRRVARRSRRRPRRRTPSAPMWANSSPNDPVFWLHHSNIGMATACASEWLRRHGPAYEPVAGGPIGQNIDDTMWPFSQSRAHREPSPDARPSRTWLPLRHGVVKRSLYREAIRCAP